MADNKEQIKEGVDKGLTPVDLRERKKYVATEKAPFHKKGEIVECHPNLGKTFLEKGYVVEIKAKEDSKGGK